MAFEAINKKNYTTINSRLLISDPEVALDILKDFVVQFNNQIFPLTVDNVRTIYSLYINNSGPGFPNIPISPSEIVRFYLYLFQGKFPLFQVGQISKKKTVIVNKASEARKITITPIVPEILEPIKVNQPLQETEEYINENEPSISFGDLIDSLEGPEKLEYLEFEFDPEVDFEPLLSQTNQKNQVSQATVPLSRQEQRQQEEINDTLDAFSESKQLDDPRIILDRIRNKTERTNQLLVFLSNSFEYSVPEILSWVIASDLTTNRKKVFEKIMETILPRLSIMTRSYFLIHLIKPSDNNTEIFYSISKEKYELLKVDYNKITERLKKIPKINLKVTLNDEVSEEIIKAIDKFFGLLKWSSLAGKEQIGFIIYIINIIITNNLSITPDSYVIVTDNSIINFYTKKEQTKAKTTKLNSAKTNTFNKDDYDDYDYDDI